MATRTPGCRTCSDCHIVAQELAVMLQRAKILIEEHSLQKHGLKSCYMALTLSIDSLEFVTGLDAAQLLAEEDQLDAGYDEALRQTYPPGDHTADDHTADTHTTNTHTTQATPLTETGSDHVHDD